MEFKEITLGEISNINKNSYKKSFDWSTVNYLDTGNITRNKIDNVVKFDLSIDKLPSRAKRIPKLNSILYSTVRPNQEHYGFVENLIENFLVSTGFAVIDVNKELADPKYIYYLITQEKITSYLHKIGEDSVSTYPAIKPSDLEELNLFIPNKTIQIKVRNILSSLDKKIELNSKIIANLEEQAQAIFKSWFVDFVPFQDGNFVESELGMIPEGWEVKELGDFIPVVTGKKNANIANDNGEYPFFTCSQEIFKTDDYSFEANAILLAGNGDFNVKRYNGKFEAYQRTYVLIPNNENHVGWLYNLIKYFLRDIVSGYKGSVINYITKGMIENFNIAVPRNIDELNVLFIFNDFELMISDIDNENKKLAEIRDALLPKLMSGEIDVSNIKIKREEVKNE